MATNQGTETIEVVTEERTWRLEIFTEKDTDPSVRVHRETVRSTVTGEIMSRDRGVVVERSLSSVAGEAFTIAGKPYTGAEIANVLSAIADIWRDQDVAAAALVAAAAPELTPAAE